MFFDQAIALHYKKGMNAKEISRILPVSHVAVWNWINIFASENKAKDMSKNNRKVYSPKSNVADGAGTQANNQELLERIAHLEKQLLMAEIKAEALDEMINVAEKMFDISIRKKAGTKQ